GDHAARPVPAVDDDADGSLHLESADEVVDVRWEDLTALGRSRPFGALAEVDEPPELLDRLAVDGSAGDRESAPVVLGWIVPPGHLNGAVGCQVGAGEVERRGRHRAHVDHVDAGCLQPTAEGATELRGADPVVLADRYPGSSRSVRAAEEGAE